MTRQIQRQVPERLNEERGWASFEDDLGHPSGWSDKFLWEYVGVSFFLLIKKYWTYDFHIKAGTSKVNPSSPGWLIPVLHLHHPCYTRGPTIRLPDAEDHLTDQSHPKINRPPYSMSMYESTPKNEIAESLTQMLTSPAGLGLLLQ